MGIAEGAAMASAVANAGAQYMMSRNESQQQSANSEDAWTRLYDPTNPLLKNLANQQLNFFSKTQDGVTHGNNVFNQFVQTPDVRNAIARTAAVAGTPQNAQSALQQLLGLGELQFNQGDIPSELALQQFNPQLNAQFNQQMSNPFAQMGVENPGQNVINAAQPIYDRNARQANAQLANIAPGRFSSAFVEQGIDLNSRMVDDFNLFQAQQLFQGEQLKQQQQQAALQFMLGSRGLAQDFNLGSNTLGLAANTQFQDQALNQRGQSINALDSFRQAQLGARDLYGQQQMGAASGLAGLQQQEFERQAAIAAMEMQQSQAALNPLMQILQSGFQYAVPSDLNAVVGGKGFPPDNPIYVPENTGPTKENDNDDDTTVVAPPASGETPKGWPSNEPYPTSQPTKLPSTWDPELYLVANPDVAHAIADGEYGASAEHHWLEFGWKERKPLATNAQDASKIPHYGDVKKALEKWEGWQSPLLGG